jgi:mannose-6-phosphate isomerase-like protein (cupin superfamily)
MNETNHKTLSLMGVTITFLSSAEETGGAWSLIEYLAPPEFKGPAPHWHKRSTEAFYVVEGHLSLQVGERGVEAKPGDFVLVPPGTVHVWRNPEATPCKFLVFLSPSGLEGYFEAMATLMREETTWPPADMGKVIALAEKFDTFSPPAPQ